MSDLPRNLDFPVQTPLVRRTLDFHSLADITDWVGCENLDGDDDKGLCDAIEGWFDDLLRLNGPGLFKPGSAVYKAYLQAINNGMPRGISMGRNLRLQK